MIATLRQSAFVFFSYSGEKTRVLLERSRAQQSDGFAEAFNEVNAAFSEVFKKLVPGGQATLRAMYVPQDSGDDPEVVSAVAIPGKKEFVPRENKWVSFYRTISAVFRFGRHSTAQRTARN